MRIKFSKVPVEIEWDFTYYDGYNFEINYDKKVDSIEFSIQRENKGWYLRSIFEDNDHCIHLESRHSSLEGAKRQARRYMASIRKNGWIKVL